MAPPWQMPKPPKRRIPGGLTGNALITAVIAALVSGVISFAVAHWQSQDAAKQAAASQQVQQVSQLESAAESFRLAAEHLYDSDQKCALKYTSSCKQLVITTMRVIQAWGE